MLGGEQPTEGARVNRENRRRQRKASDASRQPSRRTDPTTQSGTVRTSNPHRILWYSNAPWASTGYGEQTAQMVQRLSARGHEVALLANYGLEGASTVWNDIQIYPRGFAPYSDDVLAAHAAHWSQQNPDLPSVVMTLFDVWCLKAKTIETIDRIYAWTPIDHQPAPPDVSEWTKRENVTPIAMSEFGSSMLEADNIEHEYAPHGIEAVFSPTPTEFTSPSGETRSFRSMMNVPEDAFVVMMNSANKGKNPSRKAFGENLMAFGIFAATRPDAVLYMHTEQYGNMNGVHLPKLAKACGIKDEQIRFVDQYAYRNSIPKEILAGFYSASDCLLACSMGEGFGIPVVEAQACGTNVIVSDWTAQRELCGSGWRVPVQPYWDADQTSWFGIPNIQGIVLALEAAYESDRGVSNNAVAFGEQYHADRVFDEYWVPILERMENEA